MMHDTPALPEHITAAIDRLAVAAAAVDRSTGLYLNDALEERHTARLALETAIAQMIAQPGEVRVKPLVWVRNSRHENSLWTGDLGFNTYYAIEPCEKVFRPMRGVFLSEDGEDMPLEPTLAAAKAACEGDWRARILAVIGLTPAPQPAGRPQPGEVAAGDGPTKEAVARLVSLATEAQGMLRQIFKGGAFARQDGVMTLEADLRAALAPFASEATS